MTTDRKSPDNGVSEADVPETPSGEASAERPSMAELERELAELLDEAPLLPEDDDEGSGIDFVPPPHLSARPTGQAPPVEGGDPPASPEPPAPPEPPASPEPPAPPEPPTSPPEPPASPVPAELPAARQRPEPQAPPASASVAPGVGKGRRALVATLVVAAALVAGRLWTWPSETQQTRQANVGASTARVDPDPRDADSVTDPGIETPAPPNSATPAASVSPTPSAEAEAEPTVRPVETAGPDAARPFSVVDMLTALAPAGIEAGRCRHTGDPKGRAYVRVTIAAGGTVESVFAGHAYKDSETASCIERKIRAAKLAPFSGEGGSVVLPVDLR